MRKFLTKHRPSPALVIAFVALFAAIGGTSIALPGKNSVDGNDLRKNVVKNKNIKKNAVTGAKIKRNAVAASEIKDGGVGEPELRNGAVTGAKIANNTVTAGNVGPTIVRTGVSPLTQDNDGTQNGPAGPVNTAVATATCAAGEQLLSGGARWTQGNEGNDENLYINESYPTANGWRAEGIVDFGAQGQARLTAYAICLR